MRHMFATSWHFFAPIFRVPVVRDWLEYIDDNFFALSSAIALLATFVLWVNI